MNNNEDFIRELVHKSWHRGCKETDILLGYFARNALKKMTSKFLEVYSQFIYEPDWDIYAWLTNEQKSPEKYAEIVLTIQEFHAGLTPNSSQKF